MRYDCLIVDDEEALAQSTCEYFSLFGVSAFWAADSETCLQFFREHTAGLILLDINLGSSSGFDLCKQLREKTDIPILFISARRSDDDMLLALSIGGDDYIQKPYSLSVLLAKVKVVLGRYSAQPTPPLTIDGITLDEHAHTVFLNGKKVELKMMEFKLLSYLMKNQGRVISKDELFRKIWEDSITGDNTLNVHIRRLREKLESDPNNPEYIQTVWGTGYRFKGEQSS
ncbi:MAG: response regulator transcription factor [Coriobacteriia bacterium]|nr:response regulator transcription factor [Coriobacteriia bacterium]MCL2749858.1 response regulator transcription factor [Coriobacteriia bacterium]